MSSWARITSRPATPPWGATTAMLAKLPAGMKVNINLSNDGEAFSSGALGCKAWMNHRAVARERGRLDDLIIPFHGQRLVLLVHQDFEKGEKVPGIESRGRR